MSKSIFPGTKLRLYFTTQKFYHDIKKGMMI